ncbi:hypothetical protein ACWELO_14900 [Streptomyces sp. NPDC004596]
MRAVVDRLYRGSGLLSLGMARGTVAWFKEGKGPVDFLVRLAFLLGGLAMLWGFIRTAPVLMFGVTTWWVIAAFRKGKPEQPKGEAAVAPLQESSEPARAEDPKRDDSPEVLEALRKVAEPHAHLTVAAQALGTDTAHVREVLTRAGIPIGDVRMKGRGVSTGVKAEDIPSPPPRPLNLLLALVRPTTTSS